MDDTTYKTINTPGLWQQCEARSDNLEILDCGLALKQSWVYEYGRVIFDRPGLSMADIAVAECDAVYIIDEARNVILRYEGEDKPIVELGCQPGLLPVTLRAPSGIAVDQDTIYVADGQINRLIALARSNLQIRWIATRDHEGKEFESLSDVSVGRAGHVFALESGKRRVLEIDRSGRIRDVIGEGKMSKPTDVAIDTDGDVYVLDGMYVHIFRQDSTYKKIRIEGIPRSGLAVDREKQIFVGVASGEHRYWRTLYRVEADGNTTALWSSYRGDTRRLINDSRGNIYVISGDGTRLTLLEYKAVNSINSRGSYEGSYTSSHIDSTESNTEWHRFALEGNFPEGTRVDFHYYVTNDKPPTSGEPSIADGDWQQAISEAAAAQGVERREGLFLSNNRGRYLHIRVSITGDKDVSPVVEKLTVFFPRITYLKYLPAVYQEDAGSKEFLDRLLSVFESRFSNLELTIDNLSVYFDAWGTPAEFLEWLGSWLAVAADESWHDDTTRSFIENAVALYKERGTRGGLEAMLGYFTSGRIYIVENFQKRRLGSSVAGDIDTASQSTDIDAIFFPPAKVVAKMNDGTETGLADALFGTDFCFCVLLDDPGMDDRTLELIDRIIEEYKPAHTCSGLRVLCPWFYLDMHTYLGVNTYLAEPSFVLGKTSVIGRDTVLHDEEHAGQLGLHLRVGIDSHVT
jgi:phage tail-like protein